MNPRSILVALAFFLIGTAIKMGLFPLHVWLPDAYTFAPSAVSSFIAPLMTKVMAYILIRVMITVFEPSYSLKAVPVGTILTWLAAVAILVGSILAIAQSDLKRMLAYSSVSQIGYIVLGVGLANATGLVGSLLHILNHGFMKACLFTVAAALMLKTGEGNIYQLPGMHRRMPFTMAALVDRRALDGGGSAHLRFFQQVVPDPGGDRGRSVGLRGGHPAQQPFDRRLFYAGDRNHFFPPRPLRRPCNGGRGPG